MKILLVEDDKYTASMISNALTACHYLIDTTENGQTGLELTKAYSYDLILLDVIVPGMDGVSLCRELRSQGYQMPILMLTAKNSSGDRIEGLEAGADDYVVKPFDLSELVARIRALLRRRKATINTVLTWENLQLDLSTNEVTYNGKLLHLTPKEYGLLELFLRNPRRIFNRSTLLDNVWNVGEFPGERAVTTQIKGLRQKLKTAGMTADLLESVYGLGYRLKPEPTSPQLTSHQAEAEVMAAVAKIWEELRESLKEQFELFERTSVHLASGTLDSELRRKTTAEAHRLIGALGSFGLSEGSEVAQRLEQLLQNETVPGQREALQLSEWVEALKRIVTQGREAERIRRQGSQENGVKELSESPGSPLSAQLLVVDDDVVLAEQIRTAAFSGVFQVEVATNLTAARQAIDRKPIDVILLDLTFSTTAENGLTFLAELTVHNPSTPVLAIAGRDQLTRLISSISTFMNGNGDINNTKEQLIAELEALRAEVTRLKYVAGNIIKLIGTTTDIHNRKQAEVALQESQTQLNLTLQAAKLGSWQLDLTTFALTSSDQCKANYGLPLDADLSYQRLFEIIHPDDRERVQMLVRQALDTRTDYQAEYRCIWMDGSIHWIFAFGRPTYTDNGTPLRMDGISQEITGRKQAEAERSRAEEALRQSEAILRSFYDNVPMFMGVLELLEDDDTICVSCNAATAGGFGLTPEEMQNRSSRELGVPQQVLRLWIERCLEAERTQSPVQFEYLREIKGDKKWMSVTTCPIPVSAGSRPRFAYVAEDITNCKQAEEVLQQYERIVSATPDAVALVDRNYTYRIVNQNYLLWNNKRHDQVLGQKISELLGAEVFEQLVKERLDRCLAGEIIQYAAWFDYPARGQQFMSVMYAPYFEVDHTITGAVVTSHNLTDLKQAEEQIAFQASLLNQVHNAVIATDLEGHITYWNRFAETLYQWTADEVMGRTTLEVLTPPSQQHLLAERFASLQQNHRIEGELLLQRKDGSVIPVWASTVAIRDDRGDVSGFVGVSFDISARKQAEEELKQAKADLEVRVANRTTELSQANQQLQYELHQRQRVEEALRQQMERERLLSGIAQRIRQSLDVDEILATAVTEVRQTLQTDRALIFQIRPDGTGVVVKHAVVPEYPVTAEMLLPDECFPDDCYAYYCQGQPRFVTEVATDEWAACTAEFMQQVGVKSKVVAPITQPTKNSSVRVWGLLIVHSCSHYRQWQPAEVELLQQISNQLAIAIQKAEMYQQLQKELGERRQVEEALRQSEALFRSLSECSPLGIFRTDAQGKWTYTNPRCQAIGGFTFEEALEDGWRQFVHPEDLEGVLSQWTVVAAAKQECSAELRSVRQNGTMRFCQVKVAPVLSTAHQLIGSVGTVEDITESRAIEQIKNEFISIVSHELRTPLTSIRGSLGLLASEVLNDEPEMAKHMLEIAASETERLVRLVNDILDLERLESSKVTLDKQWCDATTLMQQAVEVLQSLAEENHITLFVSPLSIQIWADPDRIIQTLVNLLSNAIKFSLPESTVTLTAQTQVERILFQVQDQGRGIPADKLETIFGQFQQVDASDSRHKGGTGLGLAICRNIVQQHGGQIWVESVLGEGSTFYFTIPISSEYS